MVNLTDPILNECQRIIDKDLTLAPAYATNVLQGLARIDAELADLREEHASLDVLTQPTPKGKR